jgi:hypothetical protein
MNFKRYLKMCLFIHIVAELLCLICWPTLTGHIMNILQINNTTNNNINIKMTNFIC